jgi:hypothetical protein
MRQHSTEALREVQNELSQLGNRISSSTNRFVGVGNRLIETIEAESKAQSRQQKTIAWLTGVIAAATVAYVITTLVSVQAMREANELQRQQIEQEH